VVIRTFFLNWEPPRFLIANNLADDVFENAVIPNSNFEQFISRQLLNVCTNKDNILNIFNGGFIKY